MLRSQRAALELAEQCRFTLVQLHADAPVVGDRSTATLRPRRWSAMAAIPAGGQCGRGNHPANVGARTRAEGPPQLSATVKRSFILRGRAASAVGSTVRNRKVNTTWRRSRAARAGKSPPLPAKPAPGVPALVGAVLRVAVVEWHCVVAHAELGFGDFRQVRGDFGDPIGCQVGDELVVGVGVGGLRPPGSRRRSASSRTRARTPVLEGAQDRIPRLVRVARELGSARLLDVLDQSAEFVVVAARVQKFRPRCLTARNVPQVPWRDANGRPAAVPPSLRDESP
ncbi:unnamed protein product, partial [Mesorhabditis spiculigera]